MEYHCSKAEDIIGHLTRPLQRNTDVVAIVDPPRGGLRKLILLNIKFLLWHLFFFWGGGVGGGGRVGKMEHLVYFVICLITDNLL